MRLIISCLLSLNVAFADVTTGGRVPRVTHWCASLLKATAEDAGTDHGIGETLALIREHVGRASLVAHVRARVRPPQEVFAYDEGLSKLSPDRGAVVRRLSRLRRDLRRRSARRTPLKLNLRGEGAIASFLARQLRVAEALEAQHATAVPERGPRPRVAWEDVFDVGLATVTLGMWAGTTALFFDPARPWTYLYVAVDLLAAGFAYRPTKAAAAAVGDSLRARRRWAQTGPPPARTAFVVNAEIRRRLRAGEIDRALIYHGYAVDVPRALARPLDAATLAGLAWATGPAPGGYRRVYVDQVFRARGGGEPPTLTLILRD